MKLYIVCKYCNSKIYLNEKAKSRENLSHQLGYNFNVTCPYCNNRINYYINDVYAETEKNNTAGGAIIGGLIGLLAGPIGALSGSTIGGALGYSSDEEERKSVSKFNKNFL